MELTPSVRITRIGPTVDDYGFEPVAAQQEQIKSDQQAAPRKPSPEEEARQVAEEYAEVQRAVIRKLRRKLT